MPHEITRRHFLAGGAPVSAALLEASPALRVTFEFIDLGQIWLNL